MSDDLDRRAALPPEHLAIAGGPPIRTSLLPLTRPWIDDEEAHAAADAVRRQFLIGDGPVGRSVEADLARLCGGARVLFLNSCTSALEAAVLLSGVREGDEVILPSFTFVSCANAVVRSGGRPVFVDIDPATGNIAPSLVAQAITPRTRAVIVVHYGGRACEMASLLEMTSRHGVRLIEDAAHAIGATWQGRPLGTIGDFGCFSFHGTKDVVCGEGGALVCRDAADAGRAEVLREKGTNRSAFLRGEIDKYTWVAEGGSFVASDVLAAVLQVQLRRLPAILERKRALAGQLSQALAPLRDRVELPVEWSSINSSWHVYPVLVPPAVRDHLLAALKAEGIGAAFHYVPLHDSPYGRNHLGYRSGELPHTERFSASLIRLPLFAAMTDQDLTDVAGAMLKVVNALIPAPAVSVDARR